MNHDLRLYFGLAILFGCESAALGPCNADEVILRRTETNFSTPQALAPASSTVTTIRSTESVAQPETIDRALFIERPSSSLSTTSTSSSVVAGHPRYGQRLQLIRDQLDKGISRGWINSERASELNRRLLELSNKEVMVRSNGYLKVDCDSFEKQLTGFNIELSHSMEGHSM